MIMEKRHDQVLDILMREHNGLGKKEVDDYKTSITGAFRAMYHEFMKHCRLKGFSINLQSTYNSSIKIA